MAPLPSPFVLVPGAGGDGWFWSRVAPLLRAAGREAVVVDLPAADEDAGLQDYADVIARAADGARDLTVVAHSMGAFSAPLVADRAGVARFLLIAPMIPAPGESASDWWRTSGHADAYRASERAAGRDPDGPFDERAAFFHDVDPAVVNEWAARPQQDEAGKAYMDKFPLDAWPDAPTHVLLGRRDRVLPYEFMQRLTRERLGVDADAIDAGHLPPLARPAETADWLLKA